MTAPVRLSEREAIDTLRVIAAMHGGQVDSLILWQPSYRVPDSDIGLCVLAATADRTTPLWFWSREQGLLQQISLAELTERAGGGGVIIPGGRIDRGLGAIR